MRRICFTAITLALGLTIGATPVESADNPSAFELSTTDVAILNPNTLHVIGHGHYHVTHLESGDLFEGENDYLDGEHDREVQRLPRRGRARR